MADAIGILGFAIDTAERLYKLFKRIKNAPEEIRGLQAEVVQARGLLRHLHGDLEQDRSAFDKDLLQPIVNKAKKLMDTTSTFLTKVSKEGSSTSGRVDIKTLQWILHAGDGKKLTEDFKELYISLAAVYPVATPS